VAGAIDVRDCDRGEPVPLVAFHGTDDDAVRFDGTFDPNVGMLVGTVEGPSREDVVESWAEENGCADDADASDIGEDVDHLVYRCSSQEDVELYVVRGGGHTWPGGPTNAMAEAMAGRTTQTIDASRLIWEFFDQHPRAG
jgi:polyhydroxybutyrate depolymerase